MAEGFRKTPAGYVAHFDPEEIKLLTKLFDDVALTLEPEESDSVDEFERMLGIKTDARPPSDNAVLRMLPIASDDPEVADEFRKFTELNLREQKMSALALASMDVQNQRVVLNEEHAHAWASALNDVRLTLGARLNLATDEDSARIERLYSEPESVEDIAGYMGLLYNFTTWLQDTLMTAMLESLEN
ncbi:DUF2017 domain-containing protein [Rothia terrae]|jgi:hypothetical protein|uniref:DUF2017 domain-containing protein n=1 Tax=Rothia terrae TaxID=396015 RepID=UPI001447C5A7|nr:DUF2017 domain-containing protein [Rothia terrae]MDT0189037.1 DUF2017 domain-containing protein [Rothia terrae]NKZ33232.1 DUF2017 domain-containing protein [Rothia terrae]